MSKFYITNNSEIASRVKDSINASAFKPDAAIEIKGLYAFSTKKLNFDNSNSYAGSSGFAVAIGCPIYKGHLLCEQIFKDFDSNPDTIRDNMVGQYACSILKEEELHVFTDKLGVFNVFYYCEHGIVFISNDLYGMASILSDRITVSELNVMEYCLQSTILNDETYFNEIKSLAGKQEITYGLAGKHFEIISHKMDFTKYHGKTADEVVESAANQIIEKQSTIYKTLGDSDIFMTGGLDSRMPLAAQLYLKSNPSLHFGVGNTPLIFPDIDNGDINVDKTISKKFNLKLDFLNWTHHNPVDKDWEELTDRYGFFNLIYGGSKNIFDSFLNLPNKCSTMGYGGELLRNGGNNNWVDSFPRDYFTIDEYLQNFYLKPYAKKMKIDGYREHIKAKLLAVCEKHGLNPAHIDISDYMYLDLEYRIKADTVMLNFLNLFHYSYLLLFEKDVVECGFIDYRLKSKTIFQLSIISKIYKDVLSCPIYSHHKYRLFNPETLTLDEQGKSAPKGKKPLKTKVRDILPPFMRNIVRSFIHSYKATVKDTPDLAKYIKAELKKDNNKDFLASLKRIPLQIRYINLKHIMDRIHVNNRSN